MFEQLGKWFSVFFISMLKFIGGPLSASLLDFKPIESVIICVLGMMTSVLLFSIVGSWLKTFVLNHFRKPLLFTPKNRMIVRIWNKFGINGVAFLTPIFLTPIGGTMIATSFGESKKKILISMFISSIFWSIVLTFIFGYFKSYFI